MLLAAGVALFIMNQSLRGKLSRSEARYTELAERNRAVQQELEEQRSERESSARDSEIERNRRVEAENALQRQGRPDSPGDSADFPIFLGTAFLNRGTVGASRTVRLPDKVLWVRLRIPLKGYQEYGSYRVSLRLAGEEAVVFEKGSLRTEGSGANPVLAVRIERGKLKANDYILKLEGETAGAPPAELNEYWFRIKN